MEINEKILLLVKEKGPILPVQISKEINDNILMTSARLSELLSNKQIMASHIKVGGSPLYYAEGQETRLQNFSENLAGKEKEAFELLKEKKVLRDSALEPAVRVAMRNIKDFSIPLQVNYQDKTEIFWKWYLTNKEESELLIKNILMPKEEITKTVANIPKAKPQVKDESKTEVKTPGIKRTKPEKKYIADKIESFFEKNKIRVLERKEVKKNTEFDYILELQTSLGGTKYFCRTKNKKKITEADLSTALVHAQSKGLPLIFLTAGKLSKKAKDTIDRDFRNIIYKEI